MESNFKEDAMRLITIVSREKDKDGAPTLLATLAVDFLERNKSIPLRLEVVKATYSGSVTLSADCFADIFAEARAQERDSLTFTLACEETQKTLTVTGFTIEQMEKEVMEKGFLTIHFKE